MTQQRILRFYARCNVEKRQQEHAAEVVGMIRRQTAKRIGLWRFKAFLWALLPWAVTITLTAIVCALLMQ